MVTPPPNFKLKSDKKKVRNSNLELYRIIVMILIVAHHYVVNSGLMAILQESPLTPSSSAMLFFGAWGKTGIDCFLFITGYFMSKSDITWEKFLKLYLQIIFYAVVIYAIFYITGQESLSPKALLKLWPMKSFTQNFTGCFIMFYLFIPFINVLIRHINKNQHLILIILLLVFYSILPTIPKFNMDFNYVSWFMGIYVMAAYVRFYRFFPSISHKKWGIITLILILFGAFSIIGMETIYKKGYIPMWAPYFFVADSNKLLPILIAVSSFMYFKDLKIPHSRLINAIGGATFGVLLIHSNSDTMRQWLWRDTVDCIGHFGGDLIWVLTYAILSVLIIFVVCAGIDWFRGIFIEPYYLNFIIRHTTSIKNKILQAIRRI